MGDRTDEDLFAAYVAGDVAAFQILFARYAPLLTRLMLRDVRRRQEAEELVQDTFLHLHRSAGDFRPGAKLRPWLMTIALNLKREHFRRKLRRPEVSLELDGRMDPPAEPGWIAERHDARRQIELALASLPEKHREAIVLHWFAGLSFPEVAEIVGASLSAVKVRAHRGYKLMKSTIQGKV
ncbi:MAG TPA: sigma-70 family RNA polymerase sigma factor [Deltaproteobacteria bacterium]|nr:sigma-70 family RNA polymerase sigma factor [Deltaproteobacteria bacterium]